MKLWIKITILSILTVSILGLLIFAIISEQKRGLQAPQIVVHVEGADAFLNEKELYARVLTQRWFVPNQPSKSLDIKKIEKGIRKMEEIKDVKVFKNIGGTWKIEVWLRKPIARIFKSNGQSFYLDQDGFTISKTHLHTANVLVFSGEIHEELSRQNVNEIINNDSLKNFRKLDEIYRISNYVCNDPLLRGLIGQVYLEKNGDFVMIPRVGEQRIVFGSAYSDQQIKDKFIRLKVFYKEGLPYEGWEKYSEINVKYDGQIVCRKRNNQ